MTREQFEIHCVNSTALDDTSDNYVLGLYEFVSKNMKNIPSSELVKRGAIEDNAISSIVAWLSIFEGRGGSLYRKAESSNDIDAKVWTSIVHHKANLKESTEEFGEFNRKKLNSSFFKSLREVTVKPEGILEVENMLKEVGIVIIYEKTVGSSKVDGMASKTIAGRPFIGMSLRRKMLDSYWFTLFHELAHIKLHFDCLDEGLIDSDEEESFNDAEVEANTYSRNNLIPRMYWNRSNLLFSARPSIEDVMELSRQVGVHPCVVAGRLRRELSNYTLFNSVIYSADVREIIWG